MGLRHGEAATATAVGPPPPLRRPLSNGSPLPKREGANRNCNALGPLVAIFGFLWALNKEEERESKEEERRVNGGEEGRGKESQEERGKRE